MGLGETILAGLEQRHRVWDVTVALALVALTFAVLRPPFVLNHDAGLLLEVGRQLVEGGRPYVDYLETNPPYVHYVYALPVAVASLLGAPISVTFHILVALALGVTLLACRQVMARAAIPPMTRGLILLALVAHGMVLVVANDFGQKEQLYFLATAPWLLQVAWSPPGSLRAFLIGVVAALGAQLKPHYVLANLAWLISLVALRREPRMLGGPAVLGFVAGGIAYPMLLLSLPAESWEAISDWYVPFVARGYAAYNSPWYDILGITSLPVVLYASAFAFAWRADRRVVPALGLFLGWGLLAYLSQHKGFAYHRIPLLGAAAILAALAVGAWHRPDRPLGLSAWLVWTCAAFLLVLRAAIATPAPAPVFDLVRAHAPPGARVFWIDTAVPPAYPGLLLEGYRPANRYLPTFPFAMLYHGAEGPSYRTQEEAPPAEQRVLSELREDLQRWEPPVVVIKRGACKACPEGFDLLALLEHNGFVEQELAGYRRLGEVNELVVFARREAASRDTP